MQAVHKDIEPRSFPPICISDGKRAPVLRAGAVWGEGPRVDAKQFATCDWLSNIYAEPQPRRVIAA